MSFAEQLKIARQRAGYTQQQVADFMGVTNSTYCGYETGKRQPDVPKIKQLSRILNTSGDVLLETGFDPSAVSCSPAEKALLDQYRALPSDAQGRIRNSLSYEYQQYLGDGRTQNRSVSQIG
jgi:transcriptional regulator with XRE-family HTH domain